jgi:hypothetical protein
MAKFFLPNDLIGWLLHPVFFLVLCIMFLLMNECDHPKLTIDVLKTDE